MTSNSNHRVVRNNKSWSPPPVNFLKLNVDAHLSDDGRWGFGMILRREDGRCVGAATGVCKGSSNGGSSGLSRSTSPSEDDAAMAEAEGLRAALQLVETQQLSNVIIELDAEKIVNAMKRKKFPRNQWGRIVQICSRVRDNLGNLDISWVSREGNQAAHVLARWAILEPNKFWSTNFPS
ncbi:ribonuclease H protein, partial [Trifolium medium]|nr:ribonuclease H protein [Trifolium medium]